MVILAGIIAGGIFLFGNSLFESNKADYASTEVLENCEIQDYHIGQGRYDYTLDLLTTCGTFHTKTQDDLFKMKIGDNYTLKVTTSKRFVVGAVKE